MQARDLFEQCLEAVGAKEDSGAFYKLVQKTRPLATAHLVCVLTAHVPLCVECVLCVLVFDSCCMLSVREA